VRKDWVALAVLAAGATVEVPEGGFDLVAEAEAAAPESRAVAPAPARDLPYDRAVQRTIHNAYARSEPVLDQLLWHGVRSFELDVHTTRAGEGARAADWFVFHEDLPLARESSCATLDACLAVLGAFHRAVPEHDVVTLFLDVKDPFTTPGHAPGDLDGAIVRALGRDAIVTPEDLRARCPEARSLRDAVAGRCRFPGLRELRGKVLVAITGGTACDPSSAVATYAQGEHGQEPRPGARIALAAPDATDACPVESLDDGRFDHVAFVNLAFAERARAGAVRARGLVARVYGGGLVGGLDNEADFKEARREGAQLLATDAVNAEADPWVTLPRSAPPWRGPGAIDLGAARGAFAVVETASGDLSDDRDSFFFANETRATNADEVWTALVSVPSSHVAKAAKGCLMARASDAPDAPHAAICRPFDEGAPELVVRARRGGPTVVRARRGDDERRAAPHAPESEGFLRLGVERVTRLPRGLVVTHVVGEASADGVSWHVVGAASITGELPLRGAAVAAGGTEPVRALVGAVTRAGDDGVSAIDLTTLPGQTPIGEGSGGTVQRLARRAR
jgi:hypothetical protein